MLICVHSIFFQVRSEISMFTQSQTSGSGTKVRTRFIHTLLADHISFLQSCTDLCVGFVFVFFHSLRAGVLKIPQADGISGKTLEEEVWCLLKIF